MDNEQEEFLKKFGKKVAETRKSRHLTQEQLADIVGLHRTYIGFIEQGKRNPTIWNLYKVAQTLDIKLSEMLIDF